MGFGVSQWTRAAPLVLLARLRSLDATKLGKGIEAGADAIVLALEGAESIASLPAEAGEALWGAYLPSASREDADALKGKGCDFIVFDAEGTEAAMLREPDLGKVLQVGLEMSDGSAAALKSLSLDALWIGAGAISRPTVREVVALQRLALLSQTPLILELPPAFEPGALEALLGLGVVGVVVDGTSEADDVRLAALRQAIDALPRRERRGRTGKALLPPFGVGPDLEEEEP